MDDDYVWGSGNCFKQHYQKLEADGVIERPRMDGKRYTQQEMKKMLRSPPRKKKYKA